MTRLLTQIKTSYLSLWRPLESTRPTKKLINLELVLVVSINYILFADLFNFSSTHFQAILSQEDYPRSPMVDLDKLSKILYFLDKDFSKKLLPMLSVNSWNNSRQNSSSKSCQTTNSKCFIKMNILVTFLYSYHWLGQFWRCLMFLPCLKIFYQNFRQIFPWLKTTRTFRWTATRWPSSTTLAMKRSSAPTFRMPS